ncbi:hypothetical protein ELH96_33680 [Rhizobium leguminosarum]|nr:hypothetical protein ELH96_33680 [Rhizobium leguminosarum]
MKKFILGTAMALVMSTAAHAETVGVSMAKFDDNFLTVLRNGMTDYAKTLSGVTLQVEDAQNDVSKQQSQIQNFIASKVDAIIVNPVDTDASRSKTHRTTFPSSRARSRISSPPRSMQSSSTLSIPMRPRRCRSSRPMPAFRWFTSTVSQSTSTRCRTIRPSSLPTSRNPARWKPRKSAAFSAARARPSSSWANSPTRLRACGPRTFMTSSRRMNARVWRSSKSRRPTGTAPRAPT